MKKILDFCEISGSSVKRYEGKRKYIATGDVLDNKIISFEEVEYEHKPSRANQNAEIGDVIFAKMQNTKKVLIITKENASNIYSTGFYIIKPKENVTSKFLFWLFNSKKFNYDKDKNCKGATQKAINNEGLNKIEIKILPTIQEQLEMINKLDKIQEIIDIRKEQIEYLDELIKSQFVEMFKECKKTKLSDIANIVMGQSPNSNSYNDNEDGIPFFQGKADYGDKYTIVRHWTNSPSKLATKGDVLMSVRAPVGPVNISSCNCCIGRGLCSISAKNGITNNEYLYNALNTMQDKITLMGSGSTFKAITKNEVYSIEVPIGTIELQNKFAEFVKQVDKQKFELQKSLEKIQKLQENLMYKYFN